MTPALLRDARSMMEIVFSPSPFSHPDNAVIRDVQKTAVQRERHFVWVRADFNVAQPLAVGGIERHDAGLFLDHRHGRLLRQDFTGKDECDCEMEGFHTVIWLSCPSPGNQLEGLQEQTPCSSFFCFQQRLLR